MKSEFVSTVSHELRTPMTSIKGYIDLMYDGMAGPLTDSQRKFLRTVKDNADRLTLLVNSLLDISRLDTGMIKLALEAVAPLDVIGHVVSTLTPKAEAKGQTLTVLAQPPQPMVRADPDRVVQILTNLVDNAIKYTPSGGQITIDTLHVDGFLHIQVQDDGMGISEQDQEKLFGRFFRAESALLSGAGGAGLGLHITRSLVDLHGGEIWVESSPDQGSTFTFSLPLAAQCQSSAEDDVRFKTISYAHADRHILIVEDDVDLAHQLSHHLRGLGGYRVHVSRYGHAALNYVREPSNRVDLIVVDLHLPDIERRRIGPSIASQSRAPAHVPLIAIATSIESGARNGRRSWSWARRVLSTSRSRCPNWLPRWSASSRRTERPSAAERPRTWRADTEIQSERARTHTERQRVRWPDPRTSGAAWPYAARGATASPTQHGRFWPRLQMAWSWSTNRTQWSLPTGPRARFCIWTRSSPIRRGRICGAAGQHALCGLLARVAGRTAPGDRDDLG